MTTKNHLSNFKSKVKCVQFLNNLADKTCLKTNIYQITKYYFAMIDKRHSNLNK